MSQIILVDSELSSNNDDIIRNMVNDDHRICQQETESSSSSISNYQSSLTIHQCSSTMTIPYRTMTNTVMDNNNIIEKTPVCFSYLIRPITPCIFGRENFDDETINDDEFFVTSGGIVHSCPNIYELSMNNSYEDRKLQSCNHLMFINNQTTSINNNLNTYNTEFDRYSIIPRFQPISSTSSLSTDSINSEIELYKERHAIGLFQKYDNTISTYSSFFPTTWKSDSHLLFMPVLHHQFSFSTLMNTNKRSHSHNITIE